MTLDQIAQYVCKKRSQFDQDTVAMVYGFVQQRYEMIYNDFPWRDSQTVEPVLTVQNQSYVAMPGTIERVISIRYSAPAFAIEGTGGPGAHFLDPTDSTFLVQTEPGIFEATGIPKYYEEFTDPSTNERRIRLFPTPNTGTTMLIVGKRVMPALVAPTDRPILRNIDNTLLAYVEHDLLERQRQGGTAKLKLEEAAALMQSLKQLETEQANRPRQSKNLTVAGNSLAEMTDAVCALTGQWSLDSIILVKEFLRRNYQMVYDACLWSESTVMAWVPCDGQQIVMPEYFDRVIGLRADPKLAALVPTDLSLYFAMLPGIFEQTGSAVAFSYLTPCAVQKLPTSTERLSFVTSSNTDFDARIFVKGESNGIEVSETVLLSLENTAVQTVNGYDVPLTISKGITAKDVNITGATSGTQLQRLLAGERERKHIRLWLQPNQTAASTCLALGKRRMRPLVQDEDTPLLRDIQNVLIQGAAADMFGRLKDNDSAKVARAKADSALTTMVNLEEQQGAAAHRIIPYVEPNYDYNFSDWIVAK